MQIIQKNEAVLLVIGSIRINGGIPILSQIPLNHSLWLIDGRNIQFNNGGYISRQVAVSSQGKGKSIDRIIRDCLALFLHKFSKSGVNCCSKELLHNRLAFCCWVKGSSFVSMFQVLCFQSCGMGSLTSWLTQGLGFSSLFL